MSLEVGLPHHGPLCALLGGQCPGRWSLLIFAAEAALVMTPALQCFAQHLLGLLELYVPA
jgi:hypothetical protein